MEKTVLMKNAFCCVKLDKLQVRNYWVIIFISSNTESASLVGSLVYLPLLKGTRSAPQNSLNDAISPMPCGGTPLHPLEPDFRPEDGSSTHLPNIGTSTTLCECRLTAKERQVFHFTCTSNNTDVL